MNEHGKSDNPIVQGKLPNETSKEAAEAMEGSGLAEENWSEQNTLRIQARAGVQSALGRIRQVAQKGSRQQFTAPYHYGYNVDMLRESYYALKHRLQRAWMGRHGGTTGKSRRKIFRVFLNG